jgi:hypothetical protein
MSERIVREGLEVVPRFRVRTAAGGEYVIFAPLPDDLAERRRALQMVAAFMAWKLARGFIMAAETKAPDAIIAVAVSREAREGVLQTIARDPIGFGAPQWLDAAAIDPDLVALLPGRETVLDAAAPGPRAHVRARRRVRDLAGELRQRRARQRAPARCRAPGARRARRPRPSAKRRTPDRRERRQAPNSAAPHYKLVPAAARDQRWRDLARD